MAENAEKPREKAQPSTSPHAEREERILAYWQEHQTFKKSVEEPAGAKPKGDYTFYDGPPFATGMPHYGHILAGTIKDVIPRWKSMQGFRVRRRWGWDCHGLPVENLIEKELDLKVKKDIVNYGIGRFNEKARESVMRYADEWRMIVPRLGRWVDMDNDYRTMDTSYTESVWWIFSQLHKKGLLFEGFKSMNICPRCETTLANFEVAQGYKDITDISVYVKFEIPTFTAIDSKDSRYKVEGSAHTYFLAWTTTPWTLPGNVALAVNPDIEYIKIQDGSNFYILAKERYEALSAEWTARKLLTAPKVVETMKGSALVGISYTPLFDYYAKAKNLKNKDKGWKVYAAEFVTVEDGTGIVHIAPAFGADDYELLKKHDLPFVQHVTPDGHFKPEVLDFAGKPVKPIDTAEDKNAHQSADIEVIKWLAHHGGLFEKEKLVHSYPHCWRCDTPLLNYAASSWFVKAPALKNALLKENSKVTWVPPEIGEGRFGNWLEGTRDWAISRSRFWGAPIPVWKKEPKGKPISSWTSAANGLTSGPAGGTLSGTEPDAPRIDNEDASGEHHMVIGSIAELKKYSRPKNTYYVMRHGLALNNVEGVLSGDPQTPHYLTLLGWEEVLKTAHEIKTKDIHIDLIYASPFLRTQETAEILREKMGWNKDILHTDDRIRELGSGAWNGRPVKDFTERMKNEDRFSATPDGVESWAEIKKRMGEFIYDMERQHRGKSILIVTHETPAFLLEAAIRGLDHKETIEFSKTYAYLDNAELRKLDFVPLPHNAEYEIDLHRPYIDEVELFDEDGRRLVRVPDVFDCWFESGAMPYGESHYPFDTKDFNPAPGLFRKSKGFPADFIAEGLDQTRGWFYSMMVLGVALFGVSPYKKVIVNGLVLAEDGQKMSKRLNNYPDPMKIVDSYGADALRFYLLSSPVVRGQDLRFSEKGVDEVAKKVVNRLLNVLSFYEMYADTKSAKALTDTGAPASSNVLDQWMISRLNETVGAVTAGLESGEIDRAARPFNDLIDDLSTWYLRRSRDRFKGDDAADKAAALATTRYVLIEIAKILAPFMPFVSEDIFLRLHGIDTALHTTAVAGTVEAPSVHLEPWPVASKVDAGLSASMKTVRDIASKGLEARMAAKLNVRQPLSELRVKVAQPGTSADQKSQLLGLIKDEVNVKGVSFGKGIEKDVELDTAITPELKEEGDLRELLRKIQDMRKEKGLSVGDLATLVATDDLKALIMKNEIAIKKATNLSGIEYGAALALK